MSSRSVIIIGAGLAGLATGCYAQLNGYESQIFEHHSKPGGVVAVWKRGDYLIDGGIHFLICHKPGSAIYDVYKEIGAVGSYDIEDMTTYIRFTDETGTKSIDFSRDLEKLERDLIQIAPEDEKEIRSLIKEITWMKNSPILTDLGMSTSPPELKGRLESIKEMWQMRSFMKYFTGKYSKSAATYAEDHLQNPFLQMVVKNLFSSDGPIWFVIMILASVAAGQLGLFKGGCHEFVNSIVNTYLSLGGQIQYKATVKKILVENDTAVGIVLEDGTEHRADVTISAADGRSTIFDMLDGQYTDDRIENRYRTWRPYDPMIAVSLGVSRTFQDEVPFSMSMMKEPFEYGERSISCLPLRILNYGDVYAPPGKSVIQIMLETEWDYWATLRENREEYNAEKKRIAQELIERLEVIYSGISSQVEVIDVATPYTSWRYTLNHRGSPMGWLMTKKTLMELIPRTLPGLDNFYMAGQWVLPGGGVPGCIYTGRNVIQILCKREDREFRITRQH
ncbi:NAD(P)/FAD-dependent oxidoreductase [Candidatus Thorarchaeota archaeon]|nr:MAG: NAD(P)/FAD-dependent oxidoreductase [Candidatus Thorarchaeota archaeon]